MKELDYLVYIGRFQPPHLAHVEIIKIACEKAKHVIVLIGSPNQPRTIKNPFTWQERKEMLLASLTPHHSDCISVIPLNDKKYNDHMWIGQVQTIIASFNKSDQDHNFKVGLIGHSKDESSYYLNMFPQWKCVNVPLIEDIHATDIRTQMFELGQLDRHIIPTAIVDYIEAFMNSTAFGILKKEYDFIQSYKLSWAKAPYPPTFVTVDSVVIQSGHVLLVQRKSEPGSGLWAIPGGFIKQNERIVDAMIRELREETKLKVPIPVLKGSIKRQEVYDSPDRSLRGRTITHAYLIELPPGELPKVKGSDDADKAKWVSLNTFTQMENQMFEDHYSIIQNLVGESSYMKI